MEPGPDSRDDNVNGSDTILVISKFVIQAARKNYKDEFTVLDIFVKSNWKDEKKTCKGLIFILPFLRVCSQPVVCQSAVLLTAGDERRRGWRCVRDSVRVTLRVESECDGGCLTTPHSQLWPDSHTANTSQVQSWMSRILKSPSHWQHSIVIPRHSNIQLK